MSLLTPTKSAGFSDVVDITLSLDTNAYASGDVLAATQELANALRVSGGRAILHSLVLLDEDDQGGALEVVFLRSNVALGTENAGVSITDANAREVVGIVPVLGTDYIDIGGSKVATLTNVGLVLEGTGTSLFLGAISRDTKTYSAAGIVLKLGLLQD